MKINIFWLIICCPCFVFSQSGGNSYQFLNIETSSRSNAMGGDLISIDDNDISLAFTTPSLISSNMHNNFSLDYIDYFSDINIASFQFSHKIKDFAAILIGIKSVNYGDFQGTNEIGEIESVFSASDNVFSLGIGKKILKNISFGLNLNLLNSSYAEYQSAIFTSNMSSTYSNIDKSFSATFMAKNLGGKISSYTNSSEYIPFELQFGLSKRLQHLPFRYSLVFHNLQKYNIGNEFSLLTQTNSETGLLTEINESFAKICLRHLILSGELALFKNNLFVQGGLNFQRRFDMSLSTFSTLNGFSFGIGINLSNFKMNYSRSSYHVSGQMNSFSIMTNLSTFGL